MDAERFLIPRYLDAPPMFLIWEADTIAVAASFLCLGILVAQFALFGAIGLVMARLYSRMKSSGGRGVLVHLLYWYTPLLGSARMPSHVRQFVG